MYNLVKYTFLFFCHHQVNLKCGSTNELVQVMEPSRCEYLMEFKTPAACQSIDGDLSSFHEHGGEL